MLEGKGLEVIDLGTDVAPEKYIEAAKENNANIIALSALLTTTMTQMENVVKAAEDAWNQRQCDHYDRRSACDPVLLRLHRRRYLYTRCGNSRRKGNGSLQLK